MKTYLKAFGAIVLSCLLLQASVSFAQADRAISKDEQRQVIDKAFSLLNANYISPEKISSISKEIYRKLSTGEYANLIKTDAFLDSLNSDLETLSGDRHVNIFFDPVRVKQLVAQEKAGDQKKAYAPEFLQRAKYENFMVRKVERLDGNVGYFKFNSFVDTSLSKSTLVAAMNFLSNSSAVIIDLRQNGGGDSRTLGFLLSYFLPDSTLISQNRSRANGNAAISIENRYIVHDAAVKKMDVPVFVVVSKRTSSAAEAFAYILQSLGRATVVGEVTNGEANPGYLFPVNADMYMMIPAFESTNPVTKTNWQGKGVMPDVQVPADKALLMAQAKAYETLAGVTPVRELKGMYEWMAGGLKAEVNPANIAEDELKLMVGNYADGRQVSYSDGVLYYYRVGNSKKKLIPIQADFFGVEGEMFFRVRFVRNEKGEVVGMEGVWDNGRKEVSGRM